MRKLDPEMLPVLRSVPQVSGVRVGRVVGLDAAGGPVVDFPDNPFGPLPARTVAGVRAASIRRAFERGAEVLLAFSGTDHAAPVLFAGVRARPRRPAAAPPPAAPQLAPPEPQAPTPAALAGPRLGRVAAAEDGAVLVDYEGNPTGPRPARATVPLRNLK